MGENSQSRQIKIGEKAAVKYLGVIIDQLTLIIQ